MHGENAVFVIERYYRRLSQIGGKGDRVTVFAFRFDRALVVFDDPACCGKPYAEPRTRGVAQFIHPVEAVEKLFGFLPFQVIAFVYCRYNDTLLRLFERKEYLCPVQGIFDRIVRKYRAEPADGVFIIYIASRRGRTVAPDTQLFFMLLLVLRKR